MKSSERPKYFLVKFTLPKINLMGKCHPKINDMGKRHSFVNMRFVIYISVFLADITISSEKCVVTV